MRQSEKIGTYSIAVNLLLVAIKALLAYLSGSVALVAIRERDGALLSEAYHRNPFAGEEKGKGIKVSEWLREMGIGTVYTPKGFKGKGPGYVFSDAGEDVIVTRDRSLKEIRRNFQKGDDVSD